ncbi:RNA polymerase factor sigma-70 [Nitrosovibrio sp. Nv4]|uniref:RNA polymerase factor sigma-70 n=1 Tax=Nitrosovibrio sp. Nv4 TaxID=1945880 RepID=UPI000BD4A387|nr:RNA polymerase factor sigma-70 [Nitrosovibrio sp. Nv4]SOD42129.1 RNA polymerase sigma-70 factor, ECF subfamily [Nitrosovibrio sp. Nv4]
MIVEKQVELSDVFMAHRLQLRWAALKILGNPERAEDVVQDAYLKVCEAAAVFDIKQPLAYLFQMVRNLAIDHHRRAALEMNLFENEDEGLHVPSLMGTPEAIVISRQHLTLIAKAISELPERTRRAFELHRLEGQTHRVIAAELDISTSLVNILIHQALDHCRAAFQSA